MRTNLMRAALACAVLLMSSAIAMAAIDPIPGVDVVVHSHPAGIIVTQTTTDANGQIVLKGLAPGDYEIEIVGDSLIKAMDKLAPPAPEKKSEGSSFSLGIGGFMGGGSSHSSSHEGAGPIGGHDSHGSSHSSGGGAGVGMNIPAGGDQGAEPPPPVAVLISLLLPAVQLSREALPAVQAQREAARDVETSFTVQSPYCRGTAGQGMRIGFTVPEGGGSVALKISENQSPLPQDR